MAATIPGLRSEEDQAARLGKTLRTLRHWRRIGYGPRPTKIGRAFYYSEQAESDFVRQCEIPLIHRRQRVGGRR